MTDAVQITRPASAAISVAPVALAPVAFVAVLGLALLVVAGHAGSAALHDAAHDMRHATGFACH